MKTAAVASNTVPVTDGNGVTQPNKKGPKSKVATTADKAIDKSNTKLPTDTNPQESPPSPAKSTRSTNKIVLKAPKRPADSLVEDSTQPPPAKKPRGGKRTVAEASNQSSTAAPTIAATGDSQDTIQKSHGKKSTATKANTKKSSDEPTSTAPTDIAIEGQDPPQQSPSKGARGTKRKLDANGDEPKGQHPKAPQGANKKPKTTRAKKETKAKGSKDTAAAPINAANETQDPAQQPPADDQDSNKVNTEEPKGKRPKTAKLILKLGAPKSKSEDNTPPINNQASLEVEQSAPGKPANQEESAGDGAPKQQTAAPPAKQIRKPHAKKEQIDTDAAKKPGGRPKKTTEPPAAAAAPAVPSIEEPAPDAAVENAPEEITSEKGRGKRKRNPTPKVKENNKRGRK